MKHWDFAIGNPPYMETTESDSTRMPPVYNMFMDEAIKVAETVELITPARFLFNTGFTPKAWNEKMLSDEHFKILQYEADSSKIFPSATITGGLAVSYRNANKKCGAIGTYSKYAEVNAILQKVKYVSSNFMDEIVYPSLNYGVSDQMKQEHPDLLDRLRTSAFTTLSDLFFEQPPKDGHSYIAMIGLLHSKRTIRYIRRDYIKDNGAILDKYNLLLSEANGAAGQIGTPVPARIIGVPEILKPGVAYTQTFIGIGAFDAEENATNAAKYVQTQFARLMIGVKKATQHTPRPTWSCVPLQDFTSASDIDWTRSIAEIDQQLYKKYGLTDEEINFIETHVKEMN